MKTFIRFGFVFFACVVALIVVEITLRTTGYKPYKSSFSFATETSRGPRRLRYYRLDPELIYSFQKHVYISEYDATDVLGFRLQKHAAYTSPPYTILMIGDSFTYGQGVKHEDTYPAVLERMLVSDGAAVRVLNAGVPGYGTDQEYVYMRRLLQSMDPDIVVWNINMNDLYDSDGACLLHVQNNAVTQYPGWINTLYIQGVIYQMLPKDVTDLRIMRVLLSGIDAVAGRARYSPGCTGTYPTIPKQLEKLARLVAVTEKELHKRNIRMVTTLVPYQFYFSDSLASTDRDLYNFWELRDTLRRSGCCFFDPNSDIAEGDDAPLFRLREPPENSGKTVTDKENPADLSHTLFQKDDSQFSFGWHHLNELGNIRLAQAVLRYLHDSGNIPGATASAHMSVPVTKK